MDRKGSNWYLVKTKQHKEPLVRQLLSARLLHTFLPLLRTTRKHWGRLEATVEPLFPSYLFASFDLEAHYHMIQRTPGVVGLVCAGDEPSDINPLIIDEIKRRSTNGIVTIIPKELRPGQPVNLADGPLSGLSAIFERYMSGQARAALLVELIGGANLRVIVPTSLVTSIS